jgi:hypothetical protein
MSTNLVEAGHYLRLESKDNRLKSQGLFRDVVGSRVPSLELNLIKDINKRMIQEQSSNHMSNDARTSPKATDSRDM